MIPEAGARKEFKQAVLRHCSIWPEPGEVYAFKRPRFTIAADSKYWAVIGVTRAYVTTALMGSGGTTQERISVDNWFELIAESELKFVRCS